MPCSAGPPRRGRASKQAAHGLRVRGRDWVWHGNHPGKPRWGPCPPGTTPRPGADISGARPPRLLKRRAAILVPGSSPGALPPARRLIPGSPGPAAAAAGAGGAAAVPRRVLAGAADGRTGSAALAKSGAAPAPAGHVGPVPCSAAADGGRGVAARWWGRGGGDFCKLWRCLVLQRLEVRGCTSPSPHSFTRVKLRAARNVQLKCGCQLSTNKLSCAYFLLI